MIQLLRTFFLPRKNYWNSNRAVSRPFIYGTLAWMVVIAFSTIWLSGIFQLVRPRQPTSVPSFTIENVRPNWAPRSTSCTASGCHGSVEVNIQAGIRHDEVLVWRGDPHFQATNALYGNLGKLILQRLNDGDERRRAFENTGKDDVKAANDLAAKDQMSRLKNCMGCHETQMHLAMPGGIPPADVPPPEGVSCASCHAGDYSHEAGHHLKQANAPNPKPYSSVTSQKMVERCVQCHVGGNGADMNHELIAAGHPPLRFEYVHYKSRLHLHWKPSIESPRMEWLIGQLVSGHAALTQLVDRSGGPDWPELAEMNCAACHHDLRQDSWRSERGFPGLAATENSRSHLIVPWGNWNLELLDAVGAHSPGFVMALANLRREFGMHGASQEAIRESAKEAVKELHVALNRSHNLTEERVAEILKSASREDSRRLIWSWDRSSVLAQGVAAPHRSSKEPSRVLIELMDKVRLPGKMDSPAHFGWKWESEPATELINLFRKADEPVQPK